jgi:alpha-galactosidase
MDMTGDAPTAYGAPATISYDGDRLTVEHRGATVLHGEIEADGEPYVRISELPTGQEAVHQVFAITAPEVRLTARVEASAEAFACAAEPDPYDAPRIVRHKLGPARNLLDRAVYDRASDWLLSIDHGPEAAITPAPPGGFEMSARGKEIVLRFRPRYFGAHRGFPSFEPWNRPMRRDSLAGWCSWFAFGKDVAQDDVHHAAQVVGRLLRPYGLEVLQLDDGFQQDPVGLPETWTQPNAKFPDGMCALAAAIRAEGLEPGIWLTPMVHDPAAVEAHPWAFVQDSCGRPVRARWIGFVLDGSDEAALDTFVRPVFDAYAAMGFTYFKMDALRHLLYEGYNSQPGHFAATGADRRGAFRAVVAAAREAIGPGAYLLACWGVMPEYAGLADGVRIGDDGFGWESMAQYSSLNNVVWRNDPDHIEATKLDGYRDYTVTSLTGSLFMITDHPRDLESGDLRAIRCSTPVPFTLPGQAYDVDPSRSVHLARAATEVSGAGPRPFDASRETSVSLFQLDVATDWGEWALLARVRETERKIRFADLGLPPGRPYTVFEFWTQRLLDVAEDGFEPGPIDPKYRVQLFCIRERLDRPFLVASDRHIGCGALDVREVAWDGQTLTGVCDRVAGAPATLFVLEPSGFQLASATGQTSLAGGLRALALPATSDEATRWRLEYRRV